MRKKIISLLVAASIFVPTNFNYSHLNIAYADDFVTVDSLTDVTPKHWAYKALVTIVQDLGIMSPKAENKFMGNDISTRYEVARAFYNAAKKLEVISGLELKVKSSKKKINLSDLDPASKDVIDSVVNEYHLMQAMPGNKFMGNKNITRYELASELNNYLILLEKTVASPTKPALRKSVPFSDVPKSHWATNAVKNIVNKYQIMTGYPGNQFRGNNTLTRYELASVLNKFVDYIDKNLIPIPKYIPTPVPVETPTPVPTPIPTPVPTPLPTPIPTPVAPPIAKTPLSTYDIKIGVDIKAAGTATDTDTLVGPVVQANFWFPKWNDARFGLGLDGYFLGYGKSLTQFHNVANLRRTSFGFDLNWRIFGADYIEDPSFSVGVGYETLQWVGSGYNYSNGGPKARAVLEVPVINWLSILADEQFHYAAFQASGFTNDLVWRNELFLGVVIPAYSGFSVQVGYKDSRHSLSGKSEIYGDVGGTALLRFRF